MINIYMQGRLLIYVQRVNVLLYYLRKLPFIGKKIPYRLYGETDIKKAIGLVPVLSSIIWAFAGTFLYVWLMIKLPVEWISGFAEKRGFLLNEHALMFYVFLILSYIPGTYMVSHLTDSSKKDFVLLHVMRIQASEYYRSQLIMKGIKDTVCFMVPLLWFGFGAESIVLVGALFFTRYIGHAGVLRHYERAMRENRKVWWKAFGKIILGMGIILAAAYGIPLLIPYLFVNRYQAAEIVLLLILAGIGAVCFRKVWNYSGYTVFAKKMVSLKEFMEQDEVMQSSLTADVAIEGDISEKDLRAGKFEKKEGYDYLNAIFFERHKKIVDKAVKIRSIVIAAFGVAGTIALLVAGEDIRTKFFHAAVQMMPFLVFIMYIESTGARLCKAMFFNCDISLLKYGYYREAGAILQNFKIRLRRLLVSNAVPALMICAVILIWTIVCGQIASIWKVVPLMLGVILLSVFFSLFHLFMYYITQPYTEEKTVKSPIFSTVNWLVYLVCYACLKIRTGSWIFTAGVLVVTLIFIPVSYICVYRFAPKTFRIR